MKKPGFRYAIVERKISLGYKPRQAGEVAFGRPPGLDLARIDSQKKGRPDPARSR